MITLEEMRSTPPEEMAIEIYQHNKKAWRHSEKNCAQKLPKNPIEGRIKSCTLMLKAQRGGWGGGV
jgi:hypothetical protein